VEYWESLSTKWSPIFLHDRTFLLSVIVFPIFDKFLTANIQMHDSKHRAHLRFLNVQIFATWSWGGGGGSIRNKPNSIALKITQFNFSYNTIVRPGHSVTQNTWPNTYRNTNVMNSSRSGSTETKPETHFNP
jgi:hypothetical protein